MHYAQYKQSDPTLVKDLVEAFPFAAVIVNSSEGPVVAQAPMTFRDGLGPAGAVEFHLARINPVVREMKADAAITIFVQGPGAHISPSWFTSSFPTVTSDRSRTAPTYNYLSMVIRGRLQLIGDAALQTQIRDLVLANEPDAGWKIEELAPELWEGWRKLIQGYRVEIDWFDITAKLTPGDNSDDRAGVVQGLRGRAVLSDLSMARLVAGHDGSVASLRSSLQEITHVANQEEPRE